MAPYTDFSELFLLFINHRDYAKWQIELYISIDDTRIIHVFIMWCYISAYVVDMIISFWSITDPCNESIYILSNIISYLSNWIRIFTVFFCIVLCKVCINLTIEVCDITCWFKYWIYVLCHYNLSDDTCHDVSTMSTWTTLAKSTLIYCIFKVRSTYSLLNRAVW